MTSPPTARPEGRRHGRWRASRAAVLGFGFGGTLALATMVSPLVWAENPPVNIAPLAPGAAAQGAPTPLIPNQSFAPLVKRVLPAVVNISVTEKAGGLDRLANQMPESFRNGPFDDFVRRFFEDRRGGEGYGGMPREFSENPRGGGGTDRGDRDEEGGKRIALGSGFIIDPSGTVVTNNHVVAEAAKVEVVLQDNSRYQARVVGRDPRTDIAVLKIKADKQLPYVALGDSNAAQIGDWVVAVGNPFGLGGSVTAGVISARGRDIHAGQFDDFLQIDAPINRGNSGGPTFNVNGEVIGINTAIYSPNGGSVGIGFAVPSNVAKTVVTQLEQHGKVSRGWLGVQIQPVTPAIAASIGLDGERGAMVAAVTQDSPGSRAGLKQGDVVLSFNGAPVREMRDLPRLVAATSPGTSASLGVWRGGKSTDMQVKVGDAPENPKVAASTGDQPAEDSGRAEALGLRLATLDNDTRRELHLGRDVQGALVTRVDDGSLADNSGVSRGDVIVSINEQPVHSAQDAAQLLRDASKGSKRTALLLLNRRGVTRYVGVDLGANNKG